MKYVLCRPLGGLNDMLCQIERCCRYAEMTGRGVIVDSESEGASHWGESLGHHVMSRQRRLWLSLHDVEEDFSRLSVFPEAFEGRLDRYQLAPHEWNQPRKDAQTGSVATFDTTKDYPHDIVLHHQPGGGQASLFALMRLLLRPDLRGQLIERLARIGGPFLGLHIRSTDYRTDPGEILGVIAKARPRRLFLATDSETVRKEVLAARPAEEVFTFVEQLSTDGTPLHMDAGIPSDLRRRRNADALLDLLTLAHARQVLAPPVTGLRGHALSPFQSGFSMLARRLSEVRLIRDGFTGLSSPGLD